MFAIQGRDFSHIHYRSASSANTRAVNRVMQLQHRLWEEMRVSIKMVALFTKLVIVIDKHATKTLSFKIHSDVNSFHASVLNIYQRSTTFVRAHLHFHHCAHSHCVHANILTDIHTIRTSTVQTKQLT